MEIYKDNGYTISESGKQVAKEIFDSLKPILLKATASGANPRELEYLAAQEINLIILGAISRKQKDLKLVESAGPAGSGQYVKK